MSRPVALGSELTSTNVNADDQTGYAVAASADGTRVAYSVRLDDQGGSNAGAVRVFDWSGTAWTQVGSDILGTAANDAIGFKLAMSDDGSRVFASSLSIDTVRAYDYDSGTSDWVQVGSDIAGTGGTGDFGRGIDCSADGDRVVIGASSAGTGGVAHVYDWSGTAWTQVGATITTGTASGDLFGYDVAMSEDGNRIAVGSVFDDTPGSNAGSVRIFDWSGTAWTQVGTDIQGTDASDQEGVFVSLSSDGSRVATGAYKLAAVTLGPSYSGRARVFEYDTGTSDWVQMGSNIYGINGNDYAIAGSLSGDGTRLALGAYRSDASPSNTDTGSIRVFDWNGHEWAQFDETLFSSSPGQYENFGWSVALSRDGLTLIGGAYLEYVVSTQAGIAKVFSVPAPTWKQQGGDVQFSLSSSGEEFGRDSSFSSDGSRFVSGAYKYGSTYGAVEMFEFNTTTSDWDSIGTIAKSGVTQYFGFGNSMSADGSTIVVGGYGSSSFTGYVEVYDYGGGTTWTQRGSTINGFSSSSYFGQSVDISADGDRIVIGSRGTQNVYVYDWTGSAWSLNTTLTGLSGSDFGYSVSMTPDGETIVVGARLYNSSQGYVAVYNYNGTSWTQVGSNVVGPSFNASFGVCVDVSSDGSRFIVGAYQNDDAATNSGEARVYDWNGTSWVQVGSDINGVQASEMLGIAVGIVESGSRIGVFSYAFDDGGAQDTSLYQIFDYDTATSDWVQVGQSVTGEEKTTGATTKLSFTSSGNKFLAVDSGYDSPATNDGRVRVFQIAKAPGFKYWDGSAFADSTAVQYWDGSAWTDVTGVKYWDGSAWADPS